MPEITEVELTRQFISEKIKNKYVTNIEIIGGRYSKKKLEGIDMIKKNLPLKITDDNSKGKFLWIEFENAQFKKYYMMNTFGMTGEWGFDKLPHSHIVFTISNTGINTHVKYLYFTDQRNFGTMKFVSDKKILDDKLNKMGPDLLKTKFTDEDFRERFIQLKNKKPNNKIAEVLMNQTKNGGIGSGIGAYLVAEILYKALISPHRQLKNFTDKEIKTLSKSIKYILRKCYLSNDTTYMQTLKLWVESRPAKIKEGLYPDYHNDIIIKPKDLNLIFTVYNKDYDPNGNEVKHDQFKIGGQKRIIHWVPNLQK